ncbi:hypothetical protein D9758_006211 [Tetrapyrgos nigripes]|uniref:Uncharacterized protein n=1 Tax=Tetrapyrgos nigripes TaxID=182062 RepID=A0A8H5LLG9_9AGAR|nr:hypothetical protein D9758_006211 [Tetrapyrgos nigripes]
MDDDTNSKKIVGLTQSQIPSSTPSVVLATLDPPGVTIAPNPGPPGETAPISEGLSSALDPAPTTLSPEAPGLTSTSLTKRPAHIPRPPSSRPPEQNADTRSSVPPGAENTAISNNQGPAEDTSTKNQGNSLSTGLPSTSTSAAIDNESSSSPRIASDRSSVTHLSLPVNTHSETQSESLPTTETSTTPTSAIPNPTSIGHGGNLASPRLDIILPVVLCALLVLVIILIIILRRRYLIRTRKISMSTRDSGVTEGLRDFTVQPYILKPEYPVFQSDHSGPSFLGESNQNSASQNSVNSTTPRRNRNRNLFAWVPWHARPNDLEQARPYMLKEDISPAPNNDSASSGTDSSLDTQLQKRPFSATPSFLPGTPPSIRTRASSDHSIVRSAGANSQTGTVATARQIRLLEEADGMREQLAGYQGDILVSAERMNRIVAHIQRLEMELNSDWARGLTDDPPPMYCS